MGIALAGAAGLWWMNDQSAETAAPKIQRITPVASIPGEAVSVDFSPDGSQFVYSWTKDATTHPDLYRGGKGDPTRITSNPGSDLNPAWSPHGDLIAFARVTDGTVCKLMVVQADGFGERPIADCKGGIGVYPAWSPDGKSIVFSDPVKKEGPRILVRVDVASGAVSPVTSAEGQYSDNHPAYSPDGGSLAFVRYRTTGSADLHVMDLAAGKIRRLTNDNVIFGDMAWSADGRAIYFTSNRTGSFGLSWVAAAGGEATLALPGAINTDAIGVTGDGKRLLFELERVQSWMQVVPLRTGAAPQTISSIEAQDWHPSISPDGSQITFVSNRGGSTEIWVAGRDGSSPRAVTKFGGPHITIPSWSPDGSKLAFSANTEGNPDLYLLDLATLQLTRLTTSPAGDRDAVWSADRRSLYFSSDRSGRHEVWRLNLETSQTEQITDIGALRPQLSTDGKWLYYIALTGRKLMRQPLDDGGPAQELGNIPIQFDRLNWAVTNALYVVDPDMQDGAIMRVDPETGASDRVASLEQFMMSSASFSISRDGNFAIVSATLVLRTDIMVADGEFGRPR
jgi:Tol biopolymer transport system component